MRRLETFPDLPPAAAWLLALLVGVLWLAARIRILGRRQARREDGERPPPAWGWLAALAARTWVLPALLVLAAGLLGTIVWVFARTG